MDLENSLVPLSKAQLLMIVKVNTSEFTRRTSKLITPKSLRKSMVKRSDSR
mgnify:CR=1 FL=1